MGGLTTWDDTEGFADDDAAVPPPELPLDYRGFDPTNRQHAILMEVIGALRLLGVVLSLGGAFITLATVADRGIASPRAAMVTGLMTVPGVLYLVAAAGLVRRRYWAWVMSFIVTSLLLATLLVVVLWAILGPEEGSSLLLIVLAPYIAMPGLVMWYMVRALPVVRDAELLIRTGFSVLPAARRAEEGGSPPAQMPIFPAAPEDVTSPSPDRSVP